MLEFLAGVILFFIFVPIIIELWEIIIVCLVGSAFVLFIIYMLIEQPLQQETSGQKEQSNIQIDDFDTYLKNLRNLKKGT